MNQTTLRGGRALLATSLLSLLTFSCSSEEKGSTTDSSETLRFTAIPDDNATELEARFQPVADYLSESLGVPVEYVPTPDYAASVEMFRNGDVQLAWFGGLSGVQARGKVAGSRAIAQGGSDPTFKSYFIANAATGLTRGDDFPMSFEGRSFTFGSSGSTSGRLMPEHFIRTNTGKSPEDFFGSENQFSGSHDKTAELVQAGTFETGALNFKTYDRLVQDGRIDPDQCRIIWETPTYPDYNWTAHPVLDQRYGDGFTDRLQSALVNMKDPELLKAVDRAEGLIPATNKDFEPIAVLAEQLGFL